MVMRSTWWNLGLLALVLALAGCGGEARECQLNSNCSAGRYCSPAGRCVADCTPGGGECGAGADCNSFGMCVSRDDAGMLEDAYVMVPPDAFVVRPDVGADAYDTPDAGPPPEVCTPSRAGSVPADEDGDGAIDEGCPWYFGVPHPVPSGAAYGADMAESPRLSADGLRLFVRGRQPGATPETAPIVLTRAAIDQPFGPPAVVTYTPPATYVSSFHLSEDELEMWAQIPPPSAAMDIQVARRATTAEPFGAFMPASELNSAMNDYHPFLREDGLEILFVSARSGTPRLYRAVRAARSMAFGTPTEITFEAGPFDPPSMGEAYPSLSADGLTLFFGRDLPAGRRAYLARRVSRDSGAFGLPEEVAGLNAGEGRTEFVTVFEQSREVFFASDRPWAPGVGGWVWRAQICRDGPCVETPLACASGLRSPDGNHCYFAISTMASFGMQAASCASGGGHLATLTSRAENDFVGSFAIAGQSWLGGYDGDSGLGLPVVPQCTVSAGGCVFAWVTGEPWSYASFGAGEPNNFGGGEDGLTFVRGASTTHWNDGPFPAALPAICEIERWPTW